MHISCCVAICSFRVFSQCHMLLDLGSQLIIALILDKNRRSSFFKEEAV